MTCPHDKNGFCGRQISRKPCRFQDQTDCYYCGIASNTKTKIKQNMTTIEDLKQIDPKLVEIINEHTECDNVCSYDLIRNVYYYAYELGHDTGYNEMIEAMEAENKQLKEDNRILRQRRITALNSSTQDLKEIDDTQLFALIAKHGYHGQVYRSETPIEGSSIERIETIRIGE